jgi:hypothetical protein
MKRISAYQATDGKIFNDKNECKKHQAQLNIVDGVKAIANRINDHEDFHVDEDGNIVIGNVELVDQLARFILENGNDIKNVLSGKPLKEKQ